jgi:hypothetical protein
VLPLSEKVKVQCDLRRVEGRRKEGERERSHSLIYCYIILLKVFYLITIVVNLLLCIILKLNLITGMYMVYTRVQY